MKMIKVHVEKRFNIIIGQDCDCSEWPEPTFTAYKKSFRNHIDAFDNVQREDLSDDAYLFTQKEVDDLKARLPENMAKIVELGKVEVK